MMLKKDLTTSRFDKSRDPLSTGKNKKVIELMEDKLGGNDYNRI